MVWCEEAMEDLLLSLLLVFLLSLGGRDQLLVAQLAEALGRLGQLLGLGLACAAASAAIMAWAGASLAVILPGRAAGMLAAGLLAIAAVEMAWPARAKPPAEPTRSLGAIGIVLLARQVGDAARLVVLALAARAINPEVTASGGAIGGGAAIAIGWFAGAERLARLPLRPIRLVLAAILLIAALFIGLNALNAAW